MKIESLGSIALKAYESDLFANERIPAVGKVRDQMINRAWDASAQSVIREYLKRGSSMRWQVIDGIHFPPVERPDGIDDSLDVRWKEWRGLLWVEDHSIRETGPRMGRYLRNDDGSDLWQMDGSYGKFNITHYCEIIHPTAHDDPLLCPLCRKGILRFYIGDRRPTSSDTYDCPKCHHKFEVTYKVDAVIQCSKEA